MLKNGIYSLSLEVCVAFGLEKSNILTLWYSIDQKFHVDNAETLELQFQAFVQNLKEGSKKA
jgi:hypothetical protein